MSKPKLLLADDAATSRKVVEMAFADEGLDVTSVATGEDAMRVFAEIHPDIVIVDVNMPGPTGYELCERIKQDPETAHIPVLLAVGKFEPFDQAEAERVGADGFLTKPFQIRELIEKVGELLGTGTRKALPAETADIDSLYARSFTDTSVGEIEFDGFANLVLGDAGMDDEIIELSHPGGDSFAQDTTVTEQMGTISSANSGVVQNFIAADTSEDSGDGNLVVKPLRRKTDFPQGETPPAVDEPSDAFVTLIARRVVEKLSDKIIREIAKEEVPRLTEKLIREALDEEKK